MSAGVTPKYPRASGRRSVEPRLRIAPRAARNRSRRAGSASIQSITSAACQYRASGIGSPSSRSSNVTGPGRRRGPRCAIGAMSWPEKASWYRVASPSRSHSPRLSRPSIRPIRACDASWTKTGRVAAGSAAAAAEATPRAVNPPERGAAISAPKRRANRGQNAR